MLFQKREMEATPWHRPLAMVEGQTILVGKRQVVDHWNVVVRYIGG
jgi:hypothetical protein